MSALDYIRDTQRVSLLTSVIYIEVWKHSCGISLMYKLRENLHFPGHLLMWGETSFSLLHYLDELAYRTSWGSGYWISLAWRVIFQINLFLPERQCCEVCSEWQAIPSSLPPLSLWFLLLPGSLWIGYAFICTYLSPTLFPTSLVFCSSNPVYSFLVSFPSSSQVYHRSKGAWEVSQFLSLTKVP